VGACYRLALGRAATNPSDKESNDFDAITQGAAQMSLGGGGNMNARGYGGGSGYTLPQPINPKSKGKGKPVPNQAPVTLTPKRTFTINLTTGVTSKIKGPKNLRKMHRPYYPVVRSHLFYRARISDRQ
jgi:hypothetical protein